MVTQPHEILDFWREAGPKKWWKKDAAFDAEIKERFEKAIGAGASGKFQDWEKEPDTTLALIILLDQFSRNIYRDDARAFAQDAACLGVTKRAMANGFDRKMPDDIGVFCYMPLMHSENLDDQEQCIVEMRRLKLSDNEKFAVIHRDIIRDFGRFPHRNAVLGRETTREEQAFLDAGGFAG